ncbi:MAG: DNA-directed RNA polymerase subunit B, partial [Nanoarchaeota archaeon]|nr:DNA-directed RNA polymerase subunit B [Nanoarchaeota archaeon]
ENGRVRRPLIIIENGRSKFTEAVIEKMNEGKVDWNYLIKHGIIEYVDVKEEENLFIALNLREVSKHHTHMEVDPISILGLSASLIPYPEYNRGDRINYGAKMIGQAIGLMSNNFLIRTDTKFNVLSYPQKPLVVTNINEMIENYTEGQNIVVAVMCYDGYNLNDAVVMNKSSVDRGLFRSFYFRTYETIKKRYWGGQEDEIAIPESGIKGYRGEEAYVDLSADGLINPETRVESDSVLVGKISPLRFLSAEEFISETDNKREASLSVRHGERGIVDSVMITETLDANQLMKIKIRDYRIPEVGDKFATRHGQKGVMGILVPQEDMPFTESGITPDIIFNPHAIPSRMTIGQLLELLAGKTAALRGKIINGSAFNHMKEQEIRKILKSMGFREDGKEVMYNGKTGRKYDVMIFTGMSYYLKLDHMVIDKIHARSRGPVTLLTKQPTEGRSKRGGLRIGEMEQQCLVAHGAALTMNERFNSDMTKIPICDKCGLVATYDITKNRAYCAGCKDGEIVWVETAYAFKLALDEMKSMGIYPKLITEEI